MFLIIMQQAPNGQWTDRADEARATESVNEEAMAPPNVVMFINTVMLRY